jgi:hypothetical protein
MRADLDDAIDRAVREMLDVEPPAELRGRVLERIAQPARRFPTQWIVVPIAATALLILMVAAAWRTARNTTPVIRSTPVAQLVSAIRTSPRHVSAQPVEATRTAAASRSAAPVVRIEPSELSPSLAVAPLEALDAIDVPPVAVTRLEDRQVTIAPLAPLDQIEVQPVGPPEGRN